MVKSLVKLIYLIFDKIVDFIPESSLNKEKYFEDLKINHEKIIETYFEVKQDCYGMSDVFTEQKQIAESKSWKTFFFRLFGYNIKTQNLKFNFSNISSLSSNRVSSILFSILKTGEEIKPHKGIYKGLIRIHLGLIIPDGDCFLKINDKKNIGKKENF